MKKTIRIVIMVMLSVTTLYASTGTATETLTLKQAISIAINANLDMKQSINMLKSSAVEVKRKKAAFRPDTTITIGTEKRFNNEYDPTQDDYFGTDSCNANFRATSTFNLFNGFSDINNLRRAGLNLQAQKESLRRTGQTVVFQTIRGFFRVVTAREAIAVEKENLAAQKLQLTRIKDFCDAGKRPATDLHQQKAEISAAEYRLLAAQRNYEVNKLSLLQLLALAPIKDADSKVTDKTIEVAPPDVDTLTTNTLRYFKDNNIYHAHSKRHDLKAATLDIQAATKGIKIAKAGALPKLNLYKEIGTNYSSAFDYSGFSDQFFNGNLYGKVGLSLSIPVFSKSAKYNVAAARIQLKNEELAKEKLENQITVEVRQAVEDYRTAVKQVEVARSQLQYTTAALDSIEARYNVNAATMVELIQSRSRDLDSRYDCIDAEYNLLMQGITVAYANGDSKAIRQIISQ
ncbi:MAG: TolC family protein [bacterium]|nr:TolC family protein [bacterium]